MAYPSTAAKFYYHGLDMSPYLEGVDPTLTRSLAEHRPLGNSPVRLSAGHKKCAIALTGIYDAGPGSEEEAAWAAFDGGLAHPFSHLPAGDAPGAVAYCGLADLSKEQITAGEGFVKFPVAVVATEEVDRCVVLAPLAHREATGEGSAQAGAGATASGAAGYLHCTQLDPGATLTVQIEHSSDGAAWAQLVAFDALAAAGSAVKEVTGEVRQHTRAKWTLSGGHATFFVALGRR